jgi:Alpha galactosidase A/Alpha galactosidase C-terminal beta sandwich domain/Alpha-galactosidase, CBM13 domain
MGWSSWNSFSNTIDSTIVMEQAKAMAANGMRKAGYEYINIDEGWWLGQRDALGNIFVDPDSWPALAPGEQPGDISNIVRFIHQLGLKAGIYTDAGHDGCSMFPDLGPKYFHTGSEGHYEQDFLQFAKWGFDYVKVDWCGGFKENLDPAVQYAEIARAIAKAEKITGHHLYFSICEWGKNSPWTWAPNIGAVPADIWRTSGDIVDPIVLGHEHANRKVVLDKMLSNFKQGIHPEAQHTGFFNDPDMMVVAMPGMTEETDQLHMSLWAISGAPLLVGADLTKLSPSALATLTNHSVLAVDQDPLGLQAINIANPGPGLEIWSKLLALYGQRAVLMLNRSSASADLIVLWKDIGLDATKPAHVEDLWTGKNLGSFVGSYSAHVPAGGFAFLLLHGSDGKTVLYEPAASGSGESLKSKSQMQKQHVFRFENVTSHLPMAQVEIVYSNPGDFTRTAELWVNAQTATRISFTPTGAGRLGRVWIQATFDHGGNGNTLVFSTTCEPALRIASIEVR